MATINVALVGQGFMGRTHSNAWGQVARFFKTPLMPVMHTVYGQPEENPRAFADNWGWKNASTNWEQLVKSPEIGLVDVVTPNYMHAPVARAAIAAGKPCSCEKPIAGSLATPVKWPKLPKPPKSRRSCGSIIAVAPQWRLHISWLNREKSAIYVMCEQATYRIGLMNRCPICGGSRRNWRVLAPMAI